MTSAVEYAPGGKSILVQVTYTYDVYGNRFEEDTFTASTRVQPGRCVFDDLDAPYSTYDALNRQIEVVESGATQYTLYDGQSPLLNFNGSGTVTARYLSMPGAIDELLARQTSAGVVLDRPREVGERYHQ